MLKDIIAGMQILAKYNAKAETVAVHDEILVCGPAPEDLAKEDLDKLEEFGWRWDGDGAWGKFT